MFFGGFFFFGGPVYVHKKVCLFGWFFFFFLPFERHNVEEKSRDCFCVVWSDWEQKPVRLEKRRWRFNLLMEENADLNLDF